MAVTQNTYTGDGTTVLFSFTFPYLETTDIKVSLNGTVTTAYTLANATTIQFNTAPANGAAIRIYRQTDDSALAATFYPGSAIRSSDLNDNFTQNLYVTQESSNSAAAATTTANTALTNSTTAINTANASTATANTALSNSQTALTQSASAVSTANSASSSASSAVSTANSAAADAATALTQSSAAVSTANTSASNASTALSNSQTALTQSASALSASASATSTANTAAANAASAVSTANTANSNAAAALNAVANSVQYQLVAAVANIPASPSNGDAIEIANSTGIESFSPLANRPAGFVGDTGLSVRMQYSSAGSTWNWLNYFSNDSDTRYLKKSGGTLTGALTLNGDPTQNLQAATKQYVDSVANAGGLPLTGGTMTGQILGDNSTSPTTPGYAFDGDPNTGLYTTGADELALATGGTARLTIDSGGAVSVANSLSVGGQAAVVTNDSRLTDTRTPTDGSVTDAKVAANAAIAGSKISPDFGTQNVTTSGNITVTNQGDIRLGESTANGSNYVALQAPASLAADVTYTLPSADGTSGQVLSTNGSGTLSWATAAAGASVTTSDTPPATPNDGDLWYDSAGGRTYVYYQDPNGSQWVDASPQGGGGSGTSITTGNTTAEVIDTGSDGRFVVTTEGTERARVDSSGRLLVGTNTASGNNLLQVNTDALVNGITLGRGSGAVSTNTATGSGALQANTSGDANTAIGYRALYSTTTQWRTVAVGYQAGYSASTAYGEQVFVGYRAGESVTTGTANVLIGAYAGQYQNAITTGSNNVVLSYAGGLAAGTDSNEILINTVYNASGKGSNTGYINPNGGGVYQGNNSSSWSTTSDRRLKKNITTNDEGLEKINQIRVVNFEYRLPEEIDELDQSAAIKKEGVQLGVIAQELQQVCPDCVKEETTGVLSVDSDNLTWHLINAVKQLSAQNASQAATIAAIEARLTALEGGN